MFRLSTRRLCSLAAPTALLMAGSSAHALTVPFTEEFTAGSANWRQNTSTLDVPQVTTGGPAGAGDAYVSYARSLGTSTGVQVTFRGQSSTNASNGSFVGDWVAGGVTQLSYFVKHDAPAPLSIGTRFAASANFPAFSIYAPGTIAPNQWTQVVVAINPNNPGWQDEGVAGTTIPEKFNNLFAAIGNIQVFAQRDASVPENTTVTFSLDKVQVVPEPASLGVLGGLGLTGLLARRRKARA